MPIPSPFHERIAQLCTSMYYKDWAGYYTVCSYDTCHEKEYFAFRHSAGLIDVTPLYKYDVTGPDSTSWLSHIMVKNIRKLRVGQVTYCCWCDEQGKVIDDGTVTRLDKHHYRVTAAEPSWSWFTRFTRGYDVTLEDVSDQIGALSLQGPNSREILKAATDANMDKLKFFRMTRAKLDKKDVIITRTGYTGDLGYEIWCSREDALAVWDGIMNHGKPFNVLPCGMDAMDVTRVEAGFIMNGVDYFSAHHCLLESRKSSPYELGLGWTVNLDRAPFIGQAALKAEKAQGSKWAMVGVEMDWPSFEELCAQYGLPPAVGSGAWRCGIPLFSEGGQQIGFATSGAWSPTLKKNLALGTIQSEHARMGTKIQMEATVEYHRHKVKATVVEMPFYNPERKRS